MAHSDSDQHVDGEGACIVISRLAGLKAWCMAQRISDGRIDTLDTFLRKATGGVTLDDHMDPDRWRWEVVLVHPKNTLYVRLIPHHSCTTLTFNTRFMRPGTPHTVLMLEPSITIGRHFYATSTIRSTVASFVHSFMLSAEITNANHPKPWRVLQRMLVLWHQKLQSTEHLCKHSYILQPSPISNKPPRWRPTSPPS